MNHVGQSFLSNLQIQEQYFRTVSKPSDSRKSDEKDFTFQDILEQKVQAAQPQRALKFSKHAANRLLDRNIELTAEQMQRLSEGTQKAGAKGIRDSLVMVDDLAFIVNVPNSTVVTAMDQAQAEENIFTNIDGAVIV